MKNWLKIRKILEFRKFPRNISRTVDMNMQIDELMMSSPYFCPYILYMYMKFWRKKIAQIFKSMSPLSKHIGLNMTAIIQEDMARCFFKAKMWDFCHFCGQIKIVRRLFVCLFVCSLFRNNHKTNTHINRCNHRFVCRSNVKVNRARFHKRVMLGLSYVSQY